MDMRLVFAGGSRREAIYPAGIGVLVRKPAGRQPVEHAVEGDTVDRNAAQGQFDFAVRERRRRRAQKVQDADARRSRARAGAANLLGGRSAAERMLKSQGRYPRGD